ncbi:DUF4234 domain-containing protein [Halovivax cerinus]|uniref:DUF4234 domain-containing protein n=1 Tax=Halovivax cerinus TaxID=1487865 RepID=A0ABD5NS13_9EURY|nr:DUF4234 domain-containing protein [Halovivax cerinus]
MGANTTSVTNAGAFRTRSLGKQVLFSVLTLGFYWIYWYHVTHTQLNDGTDANFAPLMRTVGLFIPIYNLIVMWRTSHDCEAVTDQDGVLLFVLTLVFPPAFWFLVQSGINDVAK